MQGAAPDFWHRFQTLRRSQLPIESNLYELLGAFYERERDRFHTRWQRHLNRRLPSSTIRFYNRAFADVQSIANATLQSRRVPASLRRRANDAYAFRLRARATLGELLMTDVFAPHTLGIDIPPDLALAGITRSQQERLWEATHHFFLHRPQQTEILFLHECIVGSLGNRIHCAGTMPSRGELPLAPTNYWVMPAYAVHLLAEFVGASEAEIISLHFADNESAKRVLPLASQELMLVSAHLYWYLDLYVRLASGDKPPAALLTLLFSFFVIPSLERLIEQPRQALRRHAGRLVDRQFFGHVFNRERREREQINHADLAALLMKFVDELWVPTKRRVNARG